MKVDKIPRITQIGPITCQLTSIRHLGLMVAAYNPYPDKIIVITEHQKHISVELRNPPRAKK